MLSRLSNLSKSVRSIFRPDKQQDNKNATLIYSSIIVLKILERLGKCKTQNDLDDLLSLLGNSFTGMFEKFIRDIGDEKSTSLEDIINTFRRQSEYKKNIADIGKYLKTLEADICETFEAHFELDTTSKTPYDDVFEHDKWNLDGMFEHMVNETFGPMSFYFVILTIFNDVHVPVSVAHRVIIYELADIAWFIRDKDNSVLRSLCLSNPMYINHKSNRGCIGKMVVNRWGDYDDDFLLKLMQGGDNRLFFQIFDMVDADERRIQRLIALNELFNKIRESKTINMEAKIPNFIQKMRPFFFNYSKNLRQLRPLIRVITVQKKQPHFFEQEHAPDKSRDLHEILHEVSSIFEGGDVWTRKVTDCTVCFDDGNQYLFGNPSPVECEMSLLLGPQCTTCVDVKNNLCHSCASELRVCPTCRKSLVDVITVEVCPTLPSLPLLPPIKSSVKSNSRKRTAASSAEEGNPRKKRSSLMNAIRKWLNLAETDEERDLLKLLKKIQNKLNPGQQHIDFRIRECIDQLYGIKQYTPKFILDEIEKVKQPKMANEIEMVNEIITEMETAIERMRVQVQTDKEVQAIDDAYVGGRRRKTRTLKSHHRPNKTNKRNKTNKIKSRRRRN